jgi:hypothetical protein
MENMNLTETVSVLASIASLVLSIVAIWLAIVFYRLSNEASKNISDSSKQIGASVDRLEKLFDKLYSDTFSIMKDTVTDMRQHIWKVPNEPKKADEIDESIKKQIESEVKSIVQQQRGTELKVDKLAKDLEKVLENAVRQNRALKGDELKNTILSIIPSMQMPSFANLLKVVNASRDDLATTIFSLGTEGKIEWKNRKGGMLAPDDILEVVK